jgi:hypothetical protein
MRNMMGGGFANIDTTIAAAASGMGVGMGIGMA